MNKYKPISFLYTNNEELLHNKIPFLTNYNNKYMKHLHLHTHMR